MRAAFTGLLAAYLLWSLYTVRRGPKAGRFDPAAFALQAPLFLLAFIYCARGELFTRALVNPAAWILGIVLGHLVFALSLLITHGVWRDALAHFLDLRGLGGFLAEHPVILGRFFCVAATEEIIYRGAAQPLLAGWPGGFWLSIPLTALLFSMVHDHFFRNGITAAAEFLLFALALGILYHLTGSLALVILVHVTRNLESVYLEYVALVDETGDAEHARAAVESSALGRATESL